MNDKPSKDLSGLPQAVLDQLKGSKNRVVEERRHCPTQKKMLALLKEKPLQLDDIVIAFYKEYGKVTKRSSTTQIMHTLKCRGFVKPQGHMMDRFYAITDEGKEYFKNAEPKRLSKSKKSICEVDVINTILDPFPLMTMQEFIEVKAQEMVEKDPRVQEYNSISEWKQKRQTAILKSIRDREEKEKEKEKELKEQKKAPKKSWIPRFLRPQSDH